MYDYKCSVCGRKREILLPLARLDEPQRCTNCGHSMNRMLSAPYVQGDFQPYESPVHPGVWICGRKQHEEHLRATGCRVYEPGERESFLRARQADDENLDKKVEETVDKFITNLPTEKRDRLAGELEGGLDVRVERLTPN